MRSGFFFAIAETVNDYQTSNRAGLIYYVKRYPAGFRVESFPASVTIAQYCDKKSTAESVVKKWIEENGSYYQKRQLEKYGVPVIKD